jgi:hypothetical protein
LDVEEEEQTRMSSREELRAFFGPARRPQLPEGTAE